jgi:hypothetical protein
MLRSRHLIASICLIVGLLQAPAQTMPSGLRLWFRADTLTTISNGAVSRWGSLVGGHVAVAQPGTGLTPDKIGTKPAIAFANSAYFKAPSVFPVQRDYTMYVVFNWNGVHAANNLVSGQTRAFFTSAPGVTSVLHGGNFSRLSTSSRALAGPTVLRVRHIDETGQTSISLNNVKTSDDNIPSNTDSVVFIGAYAGSNGLNGSIGEILIFERVLTEAEETQIETYLHGRYEITRTPNPPKPPIHFLDAPRSLEVIDPNAGVVISGIVLSDSLEEIGIELRKDGTTVSSKTYTRPATGDTITSRVDVAFELASYAATVTARKFGQLRVDTLLSATDVVPGIVFSVNGQSNSIFGDASLPVSVWARTFGGNFSQSKADTSYSLSTATGNGGGNNVGAWALGIQNAMAEQLKTASLCISGGVGGTRIEQHLPDVNNRLNLATIYGSWLYRVIKSGSRERIRWMFWYQGESNHDEDNYAVHFDNLRMAWKQDLPNLQYIVVIQIRPGCAGPRHAQLREDQRQLQNRYPDVIVHAAGGLPGHDGCHYTGVGYATLARQLFDVYQQNERTMRPGIVRTAPMARQVHLKRLPAQKVQRVTIDVDCTEDLMMTTDALIAGKVRVARDAWFANATTSLHPISVRVEGRSIELVFPYEPPINSISYVPDYTYDDGTTVFQGPWLTTLGGVGALSFHNVPMNSTDVRDEHAETADSATVLRQILDLTGRVVGNSEEDLQRLPSGIYLLLHDTITRKVLLMR